MLLTRYFFADEFTKFYKVFKKYPYEERHFRSGEYLSGLSNTFTEVYYIQSGLVQVSVIHENGEDKIIGFWGHDSMFPIICTQQEFYLESSILMKALDDVKILVFSTDIFKQILAENPEINYEVVDHYCRFANLLLFNVTTLSCDSVLTRICNLIYTYLFYAPNEKNCVNLSQKDIASIIGTTRVSVARDLSTLRKNNTIRTARGKIYVKDLDNIKALCSSYCK